MEHLLRPDNWSVVERTRFFYCTGFFITVSPETILKVAKYASENRKVFCMNISAPFLCEVRHRWREGDLGVKRWGSGVRGKERDLSLSLSPPSLSLPLSLSPSLSHPPC